MDRTQIVIEGQPVPYRLTLDNSDPMKGHNWLFALHVPASEAGLDLADRFREACYAMPRAVRWFHQGGASQSGRPETWTMFEFWTQDEAAILEAILPVCDALGLTMQFGKVTRADLDDLKVVV